MSTPREKHTPLLLRGRDRGAFLSETATQSCGAVVRKARRRGHRKWVTTVTPAKQYIEAVGGKMHGFWYAFGDHDAYNLWEAPDNVSMVATAIAISAGGALSSFQTTVLLTVEETLAAMQKASSITYRPPGEKA